MKPHRVIVPLTPELAVVWERFQREDREAFLPLYHLTQCRVLSPEEVTLMQQSAAVAAVAASRTLEVLQKLLLVTYGLTPTASIMRKGNFLLWYDE